MKNEIWKIVRDEQGMIRGVETDKGWVCDTQFESIESCEKNARLIAAAPQLLESLKVCWASLQTYGEHPIIKKQVESAIKKATE